MSEWGEHRLGDVATVFDGPHATPKKTANGPWYLSISSLNRGRFDFSASAHLSDEDFPKWTRRVTPEPGDTLFSYETRIGDAAHWDSPERAALGRRMGLLRPNRDLVDPRFLTHAYLSPQFQELIRIKTVHGATVERLLIAGMPDWPIALPPLDEQRRIASVLGAFDDLIETNRRAIEQVRALSRNLYADLTLEVDQAIPLGDVARVSDMKTKPSTGSLRYVDIAAMGDGTIELPEAIDWADAPSRARMKAADGSTLWSTVRPNRRAHSLLIEAPDDLVVSTGIAVLTPETIGPAELFAATDTEAFVNQLVALAEGSAYPAVRPSAFKGQPIPSLPSDLSAQFENTMWPLWLDANAAANEIVDLTRARDELLPLLMSGRIRVDDMEGVA